MGMEDKFERERREFGGNDKIYSRLHKQAESCGIGYDDQMNEKDEYITHLGIVSEPEKTRDFAQFSNSPWTGSKWLSH